MATPSIKKSSLQQLKGRKRTWCKYGNCSLEKLEFELEILHKMWTTLEENWEQPEDVEDLYRIYPLLDTTAAITRKMVVSAGGEKNKKYKVEVIKPTNRRTVDTTGYWYSDEHKFFNGEKSEDLLANVVSNFLHGSEYAYMDTRKTVGSNSDFKIYVFIKTDIFCPSCAAANLENPKKDKNNFRKTTSLIRYDDCTCGQYINVRSYINSIWELVKDKINEHESLK